LKNDKIIIILNYIKIINSFLNAYIAYRIMLTILVSVASIERIFKAKDNKKLFDQQCLKNKWN